MGVRFRPDGRTLLAWSSRRIYSWNVPVPGDLPDRQKLERMVGARVDGFRVKPLSTSAFQGKQDFVAQPPFEFAEGPERPDHGPKTSFTQFRYSQTHPFHWIGAAENLKDPARAEACCRLGIMAERDLAWDLAKHWHQKAVDAGPSKWADEAQRRLKEIPARMRHLRPTRPVSPAVPASAPSTQPK